jgi:hypothetical protein
MKDYYTVLGIRPSASEGDIKSAYRRLAVQYHPDKNPTPEAAQFIVEINEAYEVLSDVEKKAVYDGLLYSKVMEAAPPPLRHRDPAYRKRPHNPNFKSQKQRTLEMMTEYLPLALLMSRVAMALFTFIALDYLLPSTTQEEVITQVVAPTLGRYQPSNKKIFTNTGTGFEVTPEKASLFTVGMPVEITYSSMVHVPTYVESKASLTTVKIPTSIYGVFIFVPIL